MNDIEVKRARVRTVAWALMMNRPAEFNIMEPCNCIAGYAKGMPDFAHTGPIGMPHKWVEAFFGLSASYFCYPPIGGADVIQQPNHIGIFWDYRRDPFLCGITLLEAIGDCGPAEKARAARLMPVVTVPA